MLGAGDGFLSGQKKYSRVRTAIREKDSVVKANLQSLELHPDSFRLLFVAFKEEKELCLYGAPGQNKPYKLIKRYSVCAASGVAGPKARQGDGQVPEGFYTIDRFNPVSSFYLSLGLDYPNTADRIRSGSADPGGDIFIHGDCASIGCLAMTDPAIKEIYLYAVYARNGGQDLIPVYLFPFEMTDERTAAGINKFPEWKTLWGDLKKGYDFWNKEHRPIHYYIDKKGRYLIQ